MTDRLDARQEAFAQALAVGAPAAEAARMAGYSSKTALAKGAVMAKRPAIKTRVAELRGPIEVPREVPALADMRLPDLRRVVAAQAYEIAQEARSARDRRGAVAALSLLSDVLGLKSSALRVESPSPFDGISTAEAQAMLNMLAQLKTATDEGRVERLADGTVLIEVEEG